MKKTLTDEEFLAREIHMYENRSYSQKTLEIQAIESLKPKRDFHGYFRKKSHKTSSELWREDQAIFNHRYDN